MNNDEMIFELSTVCDVPVYSGGLVSDEPICDGATFVPSDSAFDTTGFQNRFEWDWEPKRLSEEWRCPNLVGDCSVYMDYPTLDSWIPAFSVRAAECLKEYLEPNGELLPATSNEVLYYVYNCRKVVEVVDHSTTIGAFRQPYSPKKGVLSTASSIAYLSIFPEKLVGLSIFKLREFPNGSVYVTSRFCERVFEFGLNGFDFVKAWPLPKGVDKLSEHMRLLKQTRRNNEINTTVTSSLTKESLLVEFGLPTSNSIVDAKNAIEKFKRDVRQLLENIGPHDRYGGRLEKSLSQGGVTTLSFSCPSSRILLRRIEPGLNALRRHTPIRVVMRDVRLDQSSNSAKELFY